MSRQAESIPTAPDLPPYSRPPLDANLTRKIMSSVPGTSQILELYDAYCFHKKHDNIRWFFVYYTIILHALAMISLFYVRQCKWQTLVLAAVLYVISAFGVTAGYHRLFSHNSYKTNLPYRIMMMLFCSMASQMSIYMWASHHAVHHKGEDTNADPYNINRGFFFAHVGWTMLKPSKEYYALRAKLDLSFLKKDPIIMWQHKVWPHFDGIISYLLPPFIAMFFWGESFLCGFLVPGVLRQALVLHATYCINSISHSWSDGYNESRPYEKKIEARENWFVSLVTLGEGWHNFHHKFPYDYAAAEHPWWVQFNPSTAFIDLFALLGWVWDRKTATSAWHRIRDKRAKEDQSKGGDEVNDDASKLTMIPTTARMMVHHQEEELEVTPTQPMAG